MTETPHPLLTTAPARVAAIDCGTNSIRLLVASRNVDGSLSTLDRRLTMVRLGQGVDASGEFHPDALARTFAACDDYAAVIADLVPDAVRFVATSAARDARNREQFFTGVEQRLGVRPEIISGAEEAALSFRGALSGIPDATDPVLVMDIGGGSTELVRGSGGAIEQSVSLDVGSVRLRERVLTDEVPTARQITEAERVVDDLLDASPVDLNGIGTWVGVAGTITSMSAAKQRLPFYKAESVHASVLTPGDVEQIADEWLSNAVDQIVALAPAIPRKRAEVICAGGLVARQVARRVQRDLVVSETDILDGIAMGMLDQ